MRDCPICQAKLIVLMHVLGPHISNYDALKTYLISIHEINKHQAYREGIAKWRVS